uniref:RxLR effector protein n=1 Tax=Peronospora matthiolae TaxID=2874970 RepID=A0AAV1UG78_9STRA
MRLLLSSFAVVSALVAALSTSSTIAVPTESDHARRALRTAGDATTSAKQGSGALHGTSTLVEVPSSNQEERLLKSYLWLSKIRMDFGDIVTFFRKKGVNFGKQSKKLKNFGKALIQTCKNILKGERLKISMI